MIRHSPGFRFVTAFLGLVAFVFSVLEHEGLLRPDQSFERVLESEVEFRAFASPGQESIFVPAGRNSAETSSRKEWNDPRVLSGYLAQARNSRAPTRFARRGILHSSPRIPLSARTRLVGVVALRL